MLEIVVDHALTVENWTLFSFSWTLILLRFATRIRTVGFKGFCGDDYCAIATFICVFGDVITVHLTSRTGQNLNVTAQNAGTLTHDEVQQLILGSKLEVIAWYAYTALIWSLKFSMLFFYKRVTVGSRYHNAVKVVMCITLAAYVSLVLTLSFGCFPFQDNWQVLPPPRWACSFRPQNVYALTALNISTDLAILAIPIPMLWKLKVPVKKKVTISIFLSSGLFLIAASIVRACATFSGTPSGDNINRWGIRETALGVFTINLPILRPLFTRAFWKAGPYDPLNHHLDETHQKSWKNSRTLGSSLDRNDVELGRMDKQLYHVGVLGQGLSRNSSQEGIMRRESDTDDNKVVIVQTVHVQYEPAGPGTGRSYSPR